MQVQITINGYDHFGDLSGAEMEVITRAFRKMQRGYFTTMGPDHVFIPNENYKPDFKITTVDAVVASREEVDAYIEEERRKTRAGLVGAYFALAPGDDSTKVVKDLQNNLYYDSLIKYADREDWSFERSAADSMIFTKIDSSATIKVMKDGTVEKKD